MEDADTKNKREKKFKPANLRKLLLSIQDQNLPEQGILILGNEANGISDSLEKKVVNRISIPRFGKLQKTESLNVATATAILLSEFKR